jgi:uncharacterized protein (TIGR02996 family)
MRPDPALVAKIAAQPEAPEPRLACAQWLEEHGEGPRAELIRAQVALRDRPNPALRHTLSDRVSSLLMEHRERWAAELPGVDAKALRYSQGFIEELTLSEKNLSEHGEELLAREPVHRLTIPVQDGKGLGKAAGQPWFEQVRWLKLTGKVDEGARALAPAAHVGRLDSLLIPGVAVKGLSAVLGSEQLPGLRTLSLTGGMEEFQDEDLEVFSESRLTLERLFLSACLRLEEGIAPLLKGEWLQSLKWLALNRNELTDTDVQKLAKSKTLQNLERLELSRNELSAEGVLVFRSPKVMPRLKQLELRDIWWDARELDPLRHRFRAGLKL